MPLNFFNYMAKHLRFHELVKEEWEKHIGFVDLESVWFRVKNTKSKLKSLHKKEFQGLKENLEEWRNML